jgi:signal transduction histidine kinase
MLNIHSIPTSLAAVLALLLGVFVIIQNIRSLINCSFFMLTLSTFFWQMGTTLALTSIRPQIALINTRIGFLGIAFIPVTTYQLTIAFLGINHKNKWIIISGYLINLLCFIPMSWTSYMFNGVYKFHWGYWYRAGVFHPVFLTFFGYFMLLTFYQLYSGYKKERLPLEKNRKKYLLTALLIAYTGVVDYFPTYGFKVYPFGYLSTIFCVLIIAYAILRYRLMDITVAVTRTTIFVAVYTLVLGLPFAVALWFKNWLINIFGTYWWMSPLILMAALATTGPFIYIYFQRKAEGRLLKEQRRYQAILKQASVGMTRIRNIRRLLDLITHIVTKTVKISYAAIYLYDKETDKYILQVYRGKDTMPLQALNSDNPLICWIQLKREPLLYEEVKRQKEDSSDITYKILEDNLRLLNAAVIIPSFLEDNFMGFIVLGDKLSGQIYTPEDLNVFQVLASQAALAIENAQFYEETKQMQEQIAQAEKMATVGTMANGLSHQINNRFYALSLIAGDTIDTIKMTDTSKCTSEIKEMIKQINRALERIQANVIQGGEVVKGILKYTRKGEENFEEITLDQILDGTLEMVQYKIKLSEIDFIRDYPKDIPKIRGNIIQLQEAFFNFIDNAYDAIVERREVLKEDNYRGKISISAFVKNNFLEIIIEDNGMGVKEENIKKVFTPFFTTKVSSRKGTGLGLYVIRRIITETHKGKISFDSQYKVGTRFILELPLAK